MLSSSSCHHSPEPVTTFDTDICDILLYAISNKLSDNIILYSLLYMELT